MSGYGSGSTTGGMQPEGQTTEVGVSADHLSPKDLEVLCQTFCKCKAIGLATRLGVCFGNGVLSSVWTLSTPSRRSRRVRRRNTVRSSLTT